jgi:hypothetical protein
LCNSPLSTLHYFLLVCWPSFPAILFYARKALGHENLNLDLFVAGTTFNLYWAPAFLVGFEEKAIRDGGIALDMVAEVFFYEKLHDTLTTVVEGDFAADKHFVSFPGLNFEGINYINLDVVHTVYFVYPEQALVT